MVVDLPCFSVVRSSTSWYAFLLLFFLRHDSTFWHWPCIQVSFCHLHLRPDLSFNLSIVFSSFWLASHFLQVSSSVTKIKDLRGNPGLPLPTLIAKKFNCSVCYCLVELVTMESRSASSSTSVARGANLPPIVSWKALITVRSFSFSRSKLILGWFGFLEFLRHVWKDITTMSWSLQTSAPGNVLVLAVLRPERNRFFAKI